MTLQGRLWAFYIKHFYYPEKNVFIFSFKLFWPQIDLKEERSEGRAESSYEHTRII